MQERLILKIESREREPEKISWLTHQGLRRRVLYLSFGSRSANMSTEHTVTRCS